MAATLSKPLEELLALNLRRQQTAARIRHGLPALLALSFGGWNLAQAPYSLEELVFAAAGLTVASLFIACFVRTWFLQGADERRVLTTGDVVWVYIAAAQGSWTAVLNTRQGESVYLEFQGAGALDEERAYHYLFAIAERHPRARVGGFRRSLLSEYQLDPGGFAMRHAL